MKAPVDLITILNDTHEAKAISNVLKTLSICEECKYFDINRLSDFDRSSKLMLEPTKIDKTISLIRKSKLVLGFTKVDETIKLVRKLRGDPIYWDGAFIAVVSKSSELQTLLETSLVYEEGLHKYGEIHGKEFPHTAACRGNLVQLLDCISRSGGILPNDWLPILSDGILAKIQEELSQLNEIDTKNITQKLSKLQLSPSISHRYKEETSTIRKHINNLNSDDLPTSDKKILIYEIQRIIKTIKFD